MEENKLLFLDFQWEMRHLCVWGPMFGFCPEFLRSKGFLYITHWYYKLLCCVFSNLFNSKCFYTKQWSPPLTQLSTLYLAMCTVWLLLWK